MTFQPKDRVVVAGYGIPMTVETVTGDDVTVRHYDPKKHIWKKETFKADILQPFQPRGAITFSLGR